MANQTKPTAGDVYTFPLHDERWGLCQVIWVGPKALELVALDWIGDAPPRLVQLEGVRALDLDHHHHDRHPCRVMVSDVQPPWDFVRLGRLPLAAELKERGNSWSGWGFPQYHVLAQRRWEQIGAEDRRYYEEVHDSDEVVELQAGGASHRYHVSSRRLQISTTGRGPGGAVPSALHHHEGEAVDWATLRRLRVLSEVIYDGADLAFVDFLRELPHLSRVIWNGAQLDRVDLSGVTASDIYMEAGQTLELTLPDGLEELRLNTRPDTAWVIVRDPRKGRRLRLQLSHPLPRQLDGVEQLRSLSVNNLRLADAERFVHPTLRELSLSGAPGELRNPRALARLPELRCLELRDFYQLPAQGFPPFVHWPKLDTFEFHGLRRSDVATLRQRMRGVRMLEIRGAKNDAWIAANLDNPFRDWVDRHQRAGQSACDAYRKAHRALTRLTDATPEKVRSVVATFVAAFNKIDAKIGLDTVDREEVYEAYHTLLETAPSFDGELADEWFDEWREF